MPRAGLSAAVLVREAFRVVDDLGPDRLTLAAVAERLGVRTPSLYKHVDGLPALKREVKLASKADSAAVLADATVGKAHAEALRAFAAAYRSWANSFPGRYATTVQAPSPDDAADVAASARLYDIVVSVLNAFGLPEEDEVDAIRFVRSTLHGFVALELSGAFALPDDVDRSFDRIVDSTILTLAGWSPREAVETNGLAARHAR